MRKWLSVILSLVLLCTMLPASADSQQEPGIYRLLVRQDDSEVNVGMAVLVDQSGTGLLTSAQCLPESGSLYVSGADGTYEVTGVSVAQDGSGLARLTLSQPSTLAPMSLTLRKPASWMTPDGSGTVTNLSSDVLGELPVVTARLAPGLLPGTLLLSDNGKLSGVVISAANEGFNRYVCLSGEALYQSLSDMTFVLAMDAEPASVQEASGLPACSIDEDGRLLVDFTGCTLPEYVFFASTNNSYYNQVAADPTMRLTVAPGQTYHLWFGSSLTAESFLEPQVTIQVPQAQPLTAYSYTENESFVGIYPTSLSDEEGRLVEPQSVIAMDELMNGQELCFYTAATYQIEEEVTLPASMVLTCPDGSTVVENMSYTFAPVYMALDNWTTGITHMLQNDWLYSETRYGEYNISYYIQDKLAGSATFTLVESAPAQETVPQEEIPQEASGRPAYSIDEDGRLVLDFTGCDVPAYVCVMNPLNSYYAYEKGSDKVRFYVVPGAAYLVWYGDSLDVVDHAIDCFSVQIPQAEPLTDYSYTLNECFVGVSPTALTVAEGRQVEPQSVISMADLMEGKELCLYASASYQTTEEVTLPAIMVLTGPDGSDVVYGASYTFDPALCAQDHWTASITGMLSEYMQYSQNLYGDYTVCYYVQNKLGASASFTLTEGAAAQTEEPREEVTPGRTSITLDDDNGLTVDVSGVRQAGETWHVLLMEEGSSLYISYRIDDDALSLQLLPDRTYLVWVRKDVQIDYANVSCTLQTAELPPYTDNGFADAGSCVVLKTGDRADAVLQVTREQLASGTLYFRAASVYNVEGESEAIACFSLTTPDGMNFMYQSAYIFSPEYMALDTWDKELTSILEDADEFSPDGQLQSGTYTCSYYIQGRLAAQVSFELVDELPMATDTDLPL